MHGLDNFTHSYGGMAKKPGNARRLAVPYANLCALSGLRSHSTAKGSLAIGLSARCETPARPPSTWEWRATKSALRSKPASS